MSLDPNFSDSGDESVSADNRELNASVAVTAEGSNSEMQDECIVHLQEILGCDISTAQHMLEVHCTLSSMFRRTLLNE